MTKPYLRPLKACSVNSDPRKKSAGRPPRVPGSPTYRPAAPLITLRQAVAISEGFNASRAIPDPPRGCFAEINTCATILLSRADGGSVSPPDLIRIFFGRVADFMRYHGAPSVWAYTREDGREKGDHLHAALYVPAALMDHFEIKVSEWVARLLEMPVAGAVDVRPINPFAGGLLGWRDYMIKESTDDARAAFAIEWPRNGRKVYGKRLGMTVTLRRAIGGNPAIVIPFRSRPEPATVGAKLAA